MAWGTGCCCCSVQEHNEPMCVCTNQRVVSSTSGRQLHLAGGGGRFHALIPIRLVLRRDIFLSGKQVPICHAPACQDTRFINPSCPKWGFRAISPPPPIYWTGGVCALVTNRCAQMNISNNRENSASGILESWKVLVSRTEIAKRLGSVAVMIDSLGEIKTFVIKFMPWTWILQLRIYSHTHPPKSESSPKDIHKRIWAKRRRLSGCNLCGDLEWGQLNVDVLSVLVFSIANVSNTDFQSNPWPHWFGLRTHHIASADWYSNKQYHISVLTYTGGQLGADR
jgi:hypothetical protein